MASSITQKCCQCLGFLDEPAFGQHIVEGKAKVPYRISILGCCCVIHTECLERWTKTQKNKGKIEVECPKCGIIIEKVENIVNSTDEEILDEFIEKNVSEYENSVDEDAKLAEELQNAEYNAD